MNDDAIAAIVWGLIRLQIQCEAVINAAEKDHPGISQSVSEELSNIREQGRLLQIGINCGNTCTASFPTGNSVSLTATPADGSTFIAWSGACTGNGSCPVTMNTDQTVSAQFDLVSPPPDTVTLTVNTSGPGDGTVTSDRGGISCPSACTASFTRGTTVTLTPAPSEGSMFDEWRCGACNNERG
jgi:hypothetical protein